MEDHSKTDCKKKKNMVINLGKAGGVGMIVVGGALAIAALVAAVQSRMPKSSNKHKNHDDNHDLSSTSGSIDTITAKFIKESDKDETNGLLFLLQDSFLHIPHSDQISNIGDNRLISTQDLFMILVEWFCSEDQEKPKKKRKGEDCFLSNGTNLIEAVSLLNCSIGTENWKTRTEKDEEHKFQTNDEKEGRTCDEKQILPCFHQSLRGQSVHITTDSYLYKAREEGEQPIQAESRGLQQGRSGDEQKPQGINIPLQFCKEKDSFPIEEDQEGENSTENALPQTAVLPEQAILVFPVVEKKETISTQLDESNNVTNVEEQGTLKLSEAAVAEKVKVSAATQTSKEQEIGDCPIESPITVATAKVMEASQVKDQPEPFRIEEDKNARVSVDTEAGEGNISEVLVNIDSDISSPQEQPIEYKNVGQSGVEQNTFTAAPSVTAQLEIQENYKEVPSSAQYGEVWIGNLSRELTFEYQSHERDNLLLQSLKNLQLNYQGIEKDLHEHSYMLYDHPVTPIAEKDSDRRKQDNSPEAVIGDQGLEISEESGDSYGESTAEPVLLAESIQELSMKPLHQPLINYFQQEENAANEMLHQEDNTEHGRVICSKKVEDGGISAKNLEADNNRKGISTKISFLGRYALELAGKNDKLLCSELRWRAWTFSAIIWPLGFWYFGFHFLKLSLIAILVMALSKTQGF